MTDLLRGLDVSRHQGDIDWKQIPDRFAFALLGLTHWPTGEVDWQVANNVGQAVDRGVVVGGYQRINPLRNTPEREVAVFLSRLDGLGLLGPGKLIPGLDIEPVATGVGPDGKPINREADAGIDMVAWVHDLFQAWTAMAPDPRVLWYSSGSFYANRYGGFAGVPATVRLWPAHWSGNYSTPRNPSGDPALAEEWAGKTTYVGDETHRALIHQYWNKGTVPGIDTPVDLDCLMPGVTLTDVTQ